MRFLLESLRDLDKSLRARHSRLIVLQGSPLDEIPRVCAEWKINRLAFEKDTEPYALTRDAQVTQMAQAANVEVMSCSGHTLCDLDHILNEAPGKKPSTSYEAFRKHFTAATVKHPITLAKDLPLQLPAALGADACVGAVPSCLAEIPGYEEYQAEGEPSPFPGGETEGLSRLQLYLGRPSWLAAFDKPKTSPTELDPPSTTVLSPYLKFGCVSPRFFYLELKKVLTTRGGNHTKPPVSLEGQLLWREFYYTVGYGSANFDRMEGNPICRQIPWDDNSELLEAWKSARTGYPWIDACMMQLKTTGWLHHLARHAVACFLTRGDLWQSWVKGAEVFDYYLLDADWSLNNGNWMWLSCSCFFYQYFRCYSPVAFPKKYDPKGVYVRRFLPQLKNFPDKYIYEPWKAPLADQRKAGCIIGQDYPKPIVIHERVSKENMSKMAAAYAEHKKAAEAEKGAGGTKRKVKDDGGTSSKKAKAEPS